MGKFKNQHQSASKILKPAKLKQLREIKMRGETRPKKNRAKAKYEYENHSRAAREIFKNSRARTRAAPARRGTGAARITAMVNPLKSRSLFYW